MLIRQRDAEILGEKAAGDSDPLALQEAIQAIYDGLAPSGRYQEKGRATGLHGGNFNFDQQIGRINILDLGYNSGRNGIMPSVHVESQNGWNYFHIDAANGASIAGPVHWIWDVLLGTYVFKNGLPQ
jgi:hypothetical protein